MIRSEYSYKPVREPFIYQNGTVLQLDKCTTKFIYECFVQMKYVTPMCVLKWKTLHVDFDRSEEEWTDVFLRPYICLRETKVQSYQYNIINRIINCNKWLFDMKIKNSPVSHTVIKQMISAISSLCVRMCMNSGKRICTWWNVLNYDDVDFPAFPNVKSVSFRPQGITETVAVLIFLYISHIDSDCFGTMCSISMKSKMWYSQNWKSKKNTSVKK